MIGHLLTAAGVAGLIKTLLALHNKILPPSLNYEKSPPNSPLPESPFRVQTQPAPWRRRKDTIPRRAAVSAFGFGGINAHLLLEEWDPKRDWGTGVAHRRHTSVSKSQVSYPNSDIAIVGMDAVFGSLSSLRDFQELIFNGDTIIDGRPGQRWKGCDSVVGRQTEFFSLTGGFMEELSIASGEFHLAPNEIPQILPQQLLMLQVAAAALKDAGFPLQEDRPAMGAIIGLDFDVEATNFQLRWQLTNLLPRWLKNYDLNLPDEQLDPWIKSLQDACSPPLTAPRTLGALGGIVASRVAREFRLGGPSFTVSCEEASGLKALEIGVRALQQNEAKAFLVGAVDLTGDVRNLILRNQVRPFSRKLHIRPFDQDADGTLPGEGAAALVIKPLDQAINDGDRIYSIIKGIGSASGDGIDKGLPSTDAYTRSLKRCFREAAVEPPTISYIETHSGGDPSEDRLETRALHDFFSDSDGSCAIGSLKANIGHTGSASALAAVVKANLCLYHEIIPPLANFMIPGDSLWHRKNFHLPIYPQYWFRNRQDGPRKAVVGAMTPDGNCMHIILEGCNYQQSSDLAPEVLQKVELERKRPLGFQDTGIFIVSGPNQQALLDGLRDLNQLVSKQLRAQTSDSRKRITVEQIARQWYVMNGSQSDHPRVLSIVADNIANLKQQIAEAQSAVLSDSPRKINAHSGIGYSPHPIGKQGQLAFVFPGSGSHYIGMGRNIGTHWPEILRGMDLGTRHLRSQLLPHCYVPWRESWQPGWQKAAYENIIADPLNMIFGQVAHGGLVSGLVKYFNITPSAVIGYSLGESTGYFAMGVWPERGEMLRRMQQTDLFTRQLAGPCNAARKMWDIAPDEDVDWCVAVVNRSADTVRPTVDRYATTRLLIINTPDECVIGGRRQDVSSAIKELQCEAIYLDGVVTVHCDVLKPVADAYRQLHLFPTHRPEGIRFYSCALGRAYDLTSEKAASSILNQALNGFDFTTTINQAYQDGISIFLELGPYSSCTRMIDRILQDDPHLAISACHRGENDFTTIARLLATLIAEQVPVDLDKLYGSGAYAPGMTEAFVKLPDNPIKIPIGGKLCPPDLPLPPDSRQLSDGRNQRTADLEAEREPAKSLPQPAGDLSLSKAGLVKSEFGIVADAKQRQRADIPTSRADFQRPQTAIPFSDLIETADQIARRTEEAHQKFLELSAASIRAYTEAFNLHTKIVELALKNPENSIPAPSGLSRPAVQNSVSLADKTETSISKNPPSRPVFSRQQCLEFATGSAASVLGPEFAIVDSYPARVRLPDEPLMLVDRILRIEGQKGVLGPGRIVTEHDVLPGAWYLDGGHAPVCISVEAGQADLFLCAYLGIDLVVAGRRTYRLLDATVKFHSTLPIPGQTIRYDIEISKFIRQGQTYLFLFSFKGYIDEVPLITMTNGCAGFFTEAEVKNSGGIIITEKKKQPLAGQKPSDWQRLVPMRKERYDDQMLQALREGDLDRCFGDLFSGITLAESLRLPAGRLKLIDRILDLDPTGGKYGSGLIRAEADIHPDDWFLTCHFVDDMVMPGTLMYECCAHTLRVFLQRMGWVAERPGVYYEPVVGVESTLKCRGPVTPNTRTVIYEIEISEIGYKPQPYAIADAHMYADGHRIVHFKNMSLQMSGLTRDQIESFWKNRGTRTPPTPVFGREHMLEFASGLPSKAFGARYEPFDKGRFIARLPCPPFLMIDRVRRIEPRAWELKPAGWIEAEYDVVPDAWYFRADQSVAMPLSIIMEIALQPCGWLAAYMGSALKSGNDLRFRNLGGRATLFREILQDAGTLTIKSRLTQASEAVDMIIEHYDFEVWQTNHLLYAGNTYFGFFTQKALAQQEGIRETDRLVFDPKPQETEYSRTEALSDFAPRFPDDPEYDRTSGLALPAKAIRMIDRIEIFLPDGGPEGLGYLRGTKHVDPQDWFFKAHFYQDPVCPGSLGIESFVQLLKYMARRRWPHLVKTHRFGLLQKDPHSWIYRGQILPQNGLITVEAFITEIKEKPVPKITANGYLQVDGLYIYKMENFGIELLPI
jgi:PfaB family protein